LTAPHLAGSDDPYPLAQAAVLPKCEAVQGIEDAAERLAVDGVCVRFGAELRWADGDA